jgi:hypothetical protein
MWSSVVKRTVRMPVRVNIEECVWNLMAHGDARKVKWRGTWRMEWVASTLILPRNVVYPALLTLMRKPRLPAIDWTDAPADLNGLVRFGERRNLVSARVPSRFKRTILTHAHRYYVFLPSLPPCAQYLLGLLIYFQPHLYKIQCYTFYATRTRYCVHLVKL